MIEQAKLQQLLRSFNTRGYADPTVEHADNHKDGKILHLEEENCSYEDEFYGGEPYSGNETIWENGKVIFRVVYYGKVTDAEMDPSELYAFLRKALAVGPTGQLVHRGPAMFELDDLTYTNRSEGTIFDFDLTEKITKKGVEIYTARFIGGLVNTR